MTASSGRLLVPVFDLDGTLVDSDSALADAFLALGVGMEQVTRGHVVADECDRLGISLDDYLSAYDTTVVQPFPGVSELLASLSRWAVCSNKHPRSATMELERLGWSPEVSLFADAFDGPKRLGPVLAALGLAPEDCVFVGDTAHDRRCADEAGVRFVMAGWNPLATPGDGDRVATHPGQVLDLLDPLNW